MATMGPVFADSVHTIESMKSIGTRVPLPYLIRPRKEPPLYNSLCLYNDYVASINDDSDEEDDNDDDTSMEVDEATASLENTDCFGLQKESNASLFETGGGVPLPYLIRPRKKSPLCDSLCLYNDYVENSPIIDMFCESDEDDLPMEAVDSSSLEKTDCPGLQNESDASLSETDELSDHSLESDEDYVVVRERKTEKEGTIQIKEMSKDITPPLASDGVSEKDKVAESETEDDAGSDNGDWVVL